MKLKNGKTTLKDEKVVDNINDLCKLIRVCAESGIYEVKFKEIHLIFGEGHKLPIKKTHKIETRSQEQKSKEISEEASMAERLKMNEMEVEELRLTDPLAYETLIAQGDLDVGSST